MKSILLGAVAMATLAAAPTAWAQTRPQQPPQRTAQPAQAPTPAPTPAPGAAPAAPAQAAPPQQQARVSGWVSRCVTNARAAAPECVVEQNMTMVSTGQNVMAVVVRIAPDTRVPQLQLQLPHGVYLPAGVKLRTDTGVGLDLAFQMCDQRGCFTGNPISPELLTALKSAKRLEATVQDMSRQAQLLSMPLDGFAAAYDRVQ